MKQARGHESVHSVVSKSEEQAQCSVYNVLSVQCTQRAT